MIKNSFFTICLGVLVSFFVFETPATEYPERPPASEDAFPADFQPDSHILPILPADDFKDLAHLFSPSRVTTLPAHVFEGLHWLEAHSKCIDQCREEDPATGDLGVVVYRACSSICHWGIDQIDTVAEIPTDFSYLWRNHSNTLPQDIFEDLPLLERYSRRNSY